MKKVRLGSTSHTFRYFKTTGRKVIWNVPVFDVKYNVAVVG